MTIQTTLLVSHKGVDLHAATALRVMQRHLVGGDALRFLHRCEVHMFWDDGGGHRIDDLLQIGRYFNPNKHHYGQFTRRSDATDWADEALLGGASLPTNWPGDAATSDLTPLPDHLADILLGGEAPDGHTAVDLLAIPMGEPGALRSGVMWRLVIRNDGQDVARLADHLAIARGADQGLLVNPHLHGWLSVVRRR